MKGAGGVQPIFDSRPVPSLEAPGAVFSLFKTH